MAVQTGVVLGGTIYPAAVFTFNLLSRAGLHNKLDCSVCAPTFIFGSPPTPYKMFLNPTEQRIMELDLTDLYYLQGATEYKLTPRSNPGDIIVIGLQGLYSEPASWTGNAEAYVKLPEVSSNLHRSLSQ